MIVCGLVEAGQTQRIASLHSGLVELSIRRPSLYTLPYPWQLAILHAFLDGDHRDRHCAQVWAEVMRLNFGRCLKDIKSVWGETEMDQQPKVFIVHGRDHAVRDAIDIFLREAGLQTVVMDAVARDGRTLLEQFEQLAKSCTFAVFILTADDKLPDGAGGTRPRARQNVILEAGYFWGALGRGASFAFLVDTRSGEMELPSDIQGLGWIPITTDLAATKLGLQRELRAANLIT